MEALEKYRGELDHSIEYHDKEQISAEEFLEAIDLIIAAIKERV